jgi:hypothetical protein
MTKKPTTRLIKTSKIESTAPPEYPEYKRLDRYYSDDEVKDQVLEFQYWDKFRKPQISNKLQNFVFGGILYDKYNGLRRDEYLLKQYNIKTIGYGSWVKNEDRINFLAALAVGLWDLQTVCKTTNLGKNKLQLDWGGIGKKGASGVFFSSANLITMPRYKRPDKYLAMLEEFGRDTSDLRAKYFKKVSTTRGTVYTLNKEGKVWIMKTAGWGSFAHEFGHWIDAYIGKNQKPYKTHVTGENALPKFDSKIFLTSSTKSKERSGTIDEGYISEMLTGRRTDYNSLTMVERAFFDWLVAMYFVKQKNDTYRPNTQYKRLIQFTEKHKAKWGYWGSIVELWARTFEVYVDEFLTRKGVTNRFLVSSNAKFGRDVRYLDGGKVLVVDAASAYPTGAHVWQNKKVFEKIIDIFANL